MQCTPKLTIGEHSQTLPELTYEASVTPVLSTMSKRFGSVLGGDEIEFNGSGFTTSTMRFLNNDDEITATVLIDGKICAVSS